MSVCAIPWHCGNRDVTRIRIFFRDGKRIEGCWSCTDGLLTQVYTTEKRWRHNSAGKDFKISAAHIRDIRQRRVAPDLSHTWRDRKGVGGSMRY